MQSCSRFRPALFPAAALLCLFFAFSAHAGTLLVPEDHSLESALAAAVAGDTISVAPGTLAGGRVDLVGGVVLLSREVGDNEVAELWAVDLPEAAEVVGFEVTAHGGRGGIELQNSSLIMRHCEVDSLYAGIPEAWDYFLGIGSIIAYRGECSLLMEDCRIQRLVGECPVTDCNQFWAIAPHMDVAATADVTLRRCVVEDQDFLMADVGTVRLEDSRFRRCGLGIVRTWGDVTMTGCVVSDSRPALLWSVPLGEPFVIHLPYVDSRSGRLEVVGNTFVDNEVWEYANYGSYPLDRAVPLLRTTNADGLIERNIFTGPTGAILDAPAGLPVNCNLIWTEADTLWLGGLADPVGQDGNIFAAPFFCDREGGDFRVCLESPAATADCGPIGALGTGCDCSVPVAVQAFAARWEGSAVAVHWDLAAAAEVVLRRVSGTREPVEVYRGAGSSFTDAGPPRDAAGLRYGLGLTEPDGTEVYPVAWATVAGAPAALRTRLLGAAPNPFNPVTTIRFEVAVPGAARLSVHDAAGRAVRSWEWSTLDQGEHFVKWLGLDDAERPVAAGVYHLRLEAAGRVDGMRVVLVK